MGHQTTPHASVLRLSTWPATFCRRLVRRAGDAWYAVLLKNLDRHDDDLVGDGRISQTKRAQGAVEIAFGELDRELGSAAPATFL